VRTVAQPQKTESARQRRRRERAGRGAEAAAALWLQLKGYRILAQRVRMPACELDIIARKGRMLVFVEVKSRRTIAAAREAVTPELRRRLEQAAHQWSGRLRNANELLWRFDMMLLAPGRLPLHVRDAWRAEG
jgi:putative endonuclease